MIYRRFGFLQARLLLEKQNELQDLEAALEEMDEDDETESPGCLKRADMSFDEPTPRRQLMMDIEDKFAQYGMITR